MPRRVIGCCDELPFVDLTKVGLPDVSTTHVYLNDLNFWFVILLIVFNPFFWNLMGRWELRSHSISRLFACPKYGCAVFAVAVLTLGLIRFCRFKLVVIDTQPKWFPLQMNVFLGGGYCIVGLGLLLLFWSYWSLGFYKAHLGSCFGICPPGDVKRFPYTWLSHPIYLSTTLIYAGHALIYASQAGLWLTLILALMYIPTVKLDRALQQKVMISVNMVSEEKKSD